MRVCECSVDRGISSCRQCTIDSSVGDATVLNVSGYLHRPFIYMMIALVSLC